MERIQRIVSFPDYLCHSLVKLKDDNLSHFEYIIYMDTKELYREILNEHNINPTHKVAMDSPDFCLEGVNPSCGDQITLQLKLGEDGKISDASFTGSGCAISQASVDMMADLVIGKTKEEALALADIFDRMIKSEVTEEDL